MIFSFIRVFQITINTPMAFWDYVKHCAESLNSWNFARSKSEENLTATFPYLHEVHKERERSRNIDPIDQPWMFLTRIRLGLFERTLAHRYGVSEATVSDILVTWVNYQYIMLGSLPIWVSKDKIKKYLPEGLKGQYQDIRGNFDCTVIKCEMLKDYQTHSEMYSDYKSHTSRFKSITSIHCQRSLQKHVNNHINVVNGVIFVTRKHVSP